MQFPFDAFWQSDTFNFFIGYFHDRSKKADVLDTRVCAGTAEKLTTKQPAGGRSKALRFAAWPPLTVHSEMHHRGVPRGGLVLCAT